jgi:transcriptional regulator with XRE-family HTH domain
MEPEKVKALEEAGWRFGDAEDFLEMPDEERQLLAVRVEAARAVRRQREALKLTEKQFASRIKTSRPRIAEIEQAAAGVSLDQILRAFAAAGGRIAVKRLSPSSAKPGRSGRASARSASESQNAKVQIDLIVTESP